MDSTNSNKHDRKLRQFGIKQILLLTSLIAICNVPIGIFIRSLPPEKQLRAFLGILVISAIAAIAISVVFFRRSWAEKRAGAIRLRVPTMATTTYHILNVSSCLGLAAFMGYMLYEFVYSKDVLLSRSFQYGWPLAMWVGSAATYLVTYWWCGIDPTKLEFCEDALIQSAVVAAPWSSFHGYRWGQVDKNELFLLTDGDFIQLKVPATMREQAIECLPKFIVEKPGWAGSPR